MKPSLFAKLSSAYRFIREGAIRGYEMEQLRDALTEVVLGPGVVIRDPGRFAAGPGTCLEEGVYVNCGGDWSPEGHFSCGESCFLGAYSVIYAGGGVELGDHVALAPHVLVSSHQHPPETKGVPLVDGLSLRPVRIGNNVVVGMGATILPGVTIGDNAYVAAGALVTRDVPGSCLVAGSPARVVRTL